MPQSFKGDWNYDGYALSKNKHLAAHIGEIAYHWTMVDVVLGEMLGYMLGADKGYTVAVYLNLRGARQSALDTVAAEILPHELLLEYRTILKNARPVENMRNDVVHALWGTVDNRDDILIRIDPAAHVKWHAAEASLSKSNSTEALSLAQKTYSKYRALARAYKERDFLDIEKKIDQTFGAVFTFSEKLRESLPAQTGSIPLAELLHPRRGRT